MRIISIDPGWDKAGVAIMDKPPAQRHAEIIKLYELDMRECKNPIRAIYQWFDGFFTSPGFPNTIVIENALKAGEKPRLHADTLGAAQNRGIALARCQQIAGAIIGIALYHGMQVVEISPSEWNPSHNKKESFHDSVYRLYPDLHNMRLQGKGSRKNIGRNISSDVLDAIWIGYSFLTHTYRGVLGHGKAKEADAGGFRCDAAFRLQPGT